MWDRVEWVFAQAFARIGAVLASDLPGIVAMLIVAVAAIVAGFVVRGLLRFGLARVGFDRRAREWGITSGHGLDAHHEPSWHDERARAADPGAPPPARRRGARPRRRRRGGALPRARRAHRRRESGGPAGA